MRLLVDALPLTGGGALQVATAFLEKLRTADACDWRAVMPENLRPLVPDGLRSDPRVRFMTKSSRLDLFRLGRALAAVEAEMKPDLVFTIFGPPYFRAAAPHVVGFAFGLLLYPSKELPSLPLVERLLDVWRRRAFRGADHVIVETETVKARLAGIVGVDPDKISVVRNGVNPLLEAQRRPEAGGGDARPFGVFVPATDYPHKNLDVVPKVAAAIKALVPSLDVEFRLTLDASSRGWGRLAGEAARLGVADRVTSLGVVPLTRLGDAYQSAAAVFLPTLCESSTAVYPETFFFRRPLVTSDLDFARELCGDAALFVPPHDATAIARTLIELAASSELRRRLVAAGEAQLERGYVGADRKFAEQMAVLHKVTAADARAL